jgi:hypothetical protein
MNPALQTPFPLTAKPLGERAGVRGRSWPYLTTGAKAFPLTPTLSPGRAGGEGAKKEIHA